ncbi:hypothetical protein NMQ05_16895 [Microbacterium maritypicum]|uniref:Uncharacterized protein n=1 Tax=Microbacterium maritypicum TaxID=33918 RepID=A0ACD4B659_MICMQ|nr:hypothetical protein [Microbacterium liquefaciens]UTT52736.1 hypothetical protein NMQ05_16895 [Microbacterium liquefaciens]
MRVADDLGHGVEGEPDHSGDGRLVGHDRADGSEAHGGEGLVDDLDLGHVLLSLDEVETPLHVDESLRGDPMLLLDLCATDPQQGGDAFGIDAAFEDRRDIIETETQLAQGDDPVQPFQLRGIVGAVSGELVHVGGLEQAGRVPMPEHPVGHLADLRERSDGQHVSVLPSATVSESSIASGGGGLGALASTDERRGTGGRERERHRDAARRDGAKVVVGGDPERHPLRAGIAGSGRRCAGAARAG